MNSFFLRNQNGVRFVGLASLSVCLKWRVCLFAYFGDFAFLTGPRFSRETKSGPGLLVWPVCQFALNDKFVCFDKFDEFDYFAYFDFFDSRFSGETKMGFGLLV